MKSDKPDNRPAWSPQPGETPESFAAFVVYRDLGPTRSLAEAQRLNGKPQKGKPQKGRKRATGKRGVSGCMKRWSKRWGWPDRVLAWDAMLEAERTAAVVAAIRKEGEKWAARYEGFREDAWEQCCGDDQAANRAADHARADDEEGDGRPQKRKRTHATRRRWSTRRSIWCAWGISNAVGSSMLRTIDIYREWTRWFDGNSDGRGGGGGSATREPSSRNGTRGLIADLAPRRFMHPPTSSSRP
jgi:hypothetical protein